MWIFTGIEAHGAVIIASLPALNHLTRKAINDTSLGSRIKSSLGTESKSGYNQTGSRPGTSNLDTMKSGELGRQGTIKVTQEIQLDEYRVKGTPASRAQQVQKGGWLAGVDEETSSDEEAQLNPQRIPQRRPI